jgi:hypothetical protein
MRRRNVCWRPFDSPTPVPTRSRPSLIGSFSSSSSRLVRGLPPHPVQGARALSKRNGSIPGQHGGSCWVRSSCRVSESGLMRAGFVLTDRWPLGPRVGPGKDARTSRAAFGPPIVASSRAGAFFSQPLRPGFQAKWAASALIAEAAHFVRAGNTSRSDFRIVDRLTSGGQPRVGSATMAAGARTPPRMTRRCLLW